MIAPLVTVKCIFLRRKRYADGFSLVHYFPVVNLVFANSKTLYICKRPLPFSVWISEKKQSYPRKKGQSYPCGKKMLSSEGMAFPKESKRRENYEEQQSDQCSPGTGSNGQVQDAGRFRGWRKPDQRLQRSPDLP
jgi:hypothetical protein